MTNKTETVKAKNVVRAWHLIDASTAPLGRVTTKIATLLTGKNKVYYSPNIDCGDYVVVVNAKKVKVTGKKETNKLYYSYSGFPSGLKTLRLEEVRERGGVRIVRQAVSGMLPKNKLKDKRLARLKIYADESHPHANHFVNKEQK